MKVKTNVEMTLVPSIHDRTTQHTPRTTHRTRHTAHNPQPTTHNPPTSGVEVVMISSLGAELISSLGASYKTRYVCVLDGNVVVMPASKWVGKKVNTSKVRLGVSCDHAFIAAAAAAAAVTAATATPSPPPFRQCVRAHTHTHARTHTRTRTRPTRLAPSPIQASDFHQIITAAVASSRAMPDAKGLVVLGEGMRICEQNCVPKLAELGIMLQRR